MIKEAMLRDVYDLAWRKLAEGAIPAFNPSSAGTNVAGATTSLPLTPPAAAPTPTPAPTPVQPPPTATMGFPGILG